MKNNFHSFILVVLFATILLFLFGCSDKEDPAFISEVVSELVFDQNTVNQTITFTTNKEWEATVSSPQGFGWCPISPSSGRAGTINMTISPTEPLFPYEEKNAIIAIKAGNAIRTIRVIQKAQTAINPLKDKFEIMKEGGIFEVDVMTNVDLEMSIPSEATWIRVQPEGTRAFLTTKQIKFIVDENREQNSRQTIITIKDKNSSFSSTITVENSMELKL